MGRATKKMGITGKYGTRYGTASRKIIKKSEISQHATYTCPFCGKDSIKRSCVGIWKCKACRRVLAGGAYSLNTPSGPVIKATIARLRKQAKGDM